ncbi:SMI1/KNR4 family protein [Streptomyces sp. AM 2-1-1]|uniref:SMI1/KNR4 family protein n=1 Tax=Streptomyces sp. AM 2-1-1 TaxID=3028709 RepID=UPI0023B8E77C|nr:SMI1/KNR4 family protein [Streptomyces sp. AM 2-1-1]WEH40186.1 SMI1/KNR4 family protein [Streptomyces sp. AM 2-1-1]
MELSRFGELFGAPLVNGDVEREWRETEAAYGAGLPDDYKRFVSAYGPGRVNDQLDLFHPRAAGLRLSSLWEQTSTAYGELSRQDPEMYPCPVHPAENGFVPIARSISGNTVFLVPGPVAGEWAVAVEMGEWAVFEMSFTDFLWAALKGELHAPVIEGAARFEPLEQVEPWSP